MTHTLHHNTQVDSRRQNPYVCHFGIHQQARVVEHRRGEKENESACSLYSYIRHADHTTGNERRKYICPRRPSPLPLLHSFEIVSAQCDRNSFNLNKQRKYGKMKLPAAGNTGALHVWQKHCITESRTNPMSILMQFYLFSFLNLYIPLRTSTCRMEKRTTKQKFESNLYL